MWWFIAGYIVGGLINVFLFVGAMLKMDKDQYWELYSSHWDQLHKEDQ